VTSVQCDVAKGSCIQWPRCRNAPYLGCLAEAQLCVATRLEDHPPSLSATDLSAHADGFTASAASFLIPFILLLVMAVAAVLFAAFARAVESRRRHMKDAAAPVYVPLVSIDSPNPTLRATEDEHLDHHYATMTTVY
jgi:hypothetical protein